MTEQPQNRSYCVHADLKPMTAWVDSRVFQNMQGEISWTKIKVFALTCLPGQVPVFDILTPEGYLFSNIPPHLLLWKNPEENQKDFLSLKSLVFLNCPSIDFSMEYSPLMGEKNIFAYFREENKYLTAKYWFSLDFYKNNNRVHAIKLENGQIAFMPNHKLIVSSEDKVPEDHIFPVYQRLNQEFKV